MSNLDKFNEITAKVFADCYSSFPVPLNFCQSDYIEGVSDAESDPLFFSTLEWLKKHGYISFECPELGWANYYDVQLTEKGLTALNAVPDALKEKKTVGDKVVEVVKTGSKELMSECIRQIVRATVS